MTPIFRNLMTLETPRLLLRKMTLEDAAEMFEYAADPQVSQYGLWRPHQSLEDSQNFLQSIIEDYHNNAVAPWGIVQKHPKKFVGTCGFSEWDIEDARGEIGYALSRNHWGQGYMTEAIQSVIQFGFHTMHLNRIEARCKPENVASIRVLEKVGMTFEGLLRQQMFVKGQYWDFKLYSILQQEFF